VDNETDQARAVAEFIKPFEGFSPVPYVCPAGYWTIAYGQLCTKDHPRVTEPQGYAMLLASVPAYIAHTLRLSPVLSGDRLVAISSFIYNLGPTRYASSTLRHRVNSQDWGEARREIRKWVFGGGKKLPGLIIRREAEAALL
jgi:lysozyme